MKGNMNMKTHFDPYGSEDISGNYPCGTRVPESTEAEYSTTQWEYIDCKRCTKQKTKLIEWVEEVEKDAVDQMTIIACV